MKTTWTICAALVLFSCKTPAPQPEPPIDDDKVVVEAEPEPEPEPQLEPVKVTPKVEPKPATFVAEPKVPEELSFQETALARSAKQMRGGLTFSAEVGESCGTPTSIRATANPEGAAYTVDACSRVVDAVHAMTNVRVISKLGVIDASSVALMHDGEPIWSVLDDCAELRRSPSVCPSDFITRTATPMSFVGPVLTYHVATASAEAGGPPYSDNRAYVVDVRTGLEPKFGSLVDSDSLLDGLKRSLTLRKALNPPLLDAAKSVDEVWNLWRTQDFAFFGAYYFANWDAENGRVEMRIWYLEDAGGLDPNKLKELAIWVRPRPQWATAFEEAAAETSGFLAR